MTILRRCKRLIASGATNIRVFLFMLGAYLFLLNAALKADDRNKPPEIECPCDTVVSYVCLSAELSAANTHLRIDRADSVIILTAPRDPYGWWSDGTLGIVGYPGGPYHLTIIAVNSCGADTCELYWKVAGVKDPQIACPESTLIMSVCGQASAGSVPLAISDAMNVEAIVLEGPDGAEASWQENLLSIAVIDTGLYRLKVIASNKCKAKTCEVVVKVSYGGDGPVISCPLIELNTHATAFPEVVHVPLAVADAHEVTVHSNEVTAVWDEGEVSFEASEARLYSFMVVANNECSTDTCFFSVNVLATEEEVVVPTPEWINVYCALPTLDGVPLNPGDVITAFDPHGVLCGKDVVKENGQFGFMPIYRDDIYSPEDEGAEPGDTIRFKLNGTEIYPATTVVWTGNSDGFQVCEFLSESPIICRTLHLHEGWNLISWNVAVSGNIESFISGFAGCVELALGFDHGGMTYDPLYPQFSTLWSVDYHHGYWFKLSCDVDVDICGLPIDEHEGIALRKGWNLVSYWPEEVLPIEEGFGSLGENLLAALGYDGTGLVYLPGDGEFNTLTELAPYNGYWVKTAVEALLVYPGYQSDKEVRASEIASTAATSRSWVSAYGAGLTLDGNPISAGAVIRFVSPEGIVCGEGGYDGSILKFTPVYGADGSEEALSYPRTGEDVQVYVNDVRTYPDIAWTMHGDRVDIGDRYSSPKLTLPNSYRLAQNYPNPFNPATEISFTLGAREKIRLTVFNLLGQQVAILADGVYASGSHTIRWNGRDTNGQTVTSGVYFYRLEAASFVETKKMILMK